MHRGLSSSSKSSCVLPTVLILNSLTFSAIIFGLSQNDVIDCDISDSYPIGFTDCNLNVFSKDRIAEADCGKAAMNIHVYAYTCMYCTCVYRYLQSSMCRCITTCMMYSCVLHVYVCAMPEQLVVHVLVHVYMMQSGSHKLLQNIEV